MTEDNTKQPEVKQKRKAIQITSSVTNTGQVILFALCDDGFNEKPYIDLYRENGEMIESLSFPRIANTLSWGPNMILASGHDDAIIRLWDVSIHVQSH